MRALLETTGEELLLWLKDQGQPPMRARQVRRWIFEGRAESFDAMSDLPKTLRETLAGGFTVFSSRIDRSLTASDGTNKLLLRLADDNLVECVLLHEDDRHTVCISTQVGCGMGCVFCASGLGGLERNLSPGEILEQLIRLRNLLPAAQRLTHIVVMGMGEPLANLDNLLAALDVVTARDGLGLGQRHITISTVGLPAKMKRLADLKKQYHLAVSLHAPNDALRTQIVPTNEQTGLADILEAADYFHAQTKRQVTYEYVMLRDVNDQPTHAEELARLLQGRQAHINLIPFNDVEGLPYHRPLQTILTEFVTRLRRRGMIVHLRKRKGADIDAACGQLRRSALVQVGVTK
jgi:23S rRNA (adenine2503-C2)-methyltransferase